MYFWHSAGNNMYLKQPNNMKLIVEPEIEFQVNPNLTATEAIYHGGFKYHDHDAMFRNAVCEPGPPRFVSIATYRVEGGTIEEPLSRFKQECQETGYIPANLWHLCLLAHYYPQMHRRIIAAPGTVVSAEGFDYMPTIDGLYRHASCISKIKTELMPTDLNDSGFAHISYKKYELLAVKYI